ncbi:MAG TPA: beta-L-arabinofuranosidase domain-containing protein [Gemmatimonadaceae bacterium]|nr:beta-L-arabinofuranosidase domain-containing protein [Gemmatimonadaceae bacterium]
MAGVSPPHPGPERGTSVEGDCSCGAPEGPTSVTRRVALQSLALTFALPAAALLHAPGVAAATGRQVTAKRAVDSFDLSAVRLLDGPFKSAQALDAKYLLSLEPDRLLHNFRVNAGLTPKAPVYGGWESQEPWVDIRCHGHTLGHYLSACSMMVASTGGPALSQRVAYIVSELRECQRARGNGLVCAFPDGATPLENSLSGKPFAGVPWYTMHKVLAGLRDAHIHAASPDALTVLLGLVDWIDTAARDVPDVQFQRMLDREHGGMSEVLADVHVLTGDAKHLALAERFTHHALLDPLAAGRDTLDGLHSNTQIPKAIGFARLHELTARDDYRNASSFFWHTVVERRSFATGGNGDVEHFFPRTQFAQHLRSAKTMETCCTHNLLRLTRALFTREPSVAYADYYERALYNGILASQDPQSGMMTYFQATRPGYVKLYCTPTDSFWCCTGSGMENHAKYGDSIYFHDDRSLYVNLFMASELDWAAKNLHITQRTRFPDEASTVLAIRAKRPTRLTLKIRQPSWCEAAAVSINRQPQSHNGTPGRYIELDQTWRDGDVVEVSLPMQLHLEPLPGAPDIVALMYGPLVLAGRLGTDGITPGSDRIVNERTSGEMLNRPMELPRLAMSAGDVRGKVKPLGTSPLTFITRALDPDRDVELVPFHRIAHERYTLYWRVEPLLSSPDGRIAVQFGVDEEGHPVYSVLRDGGAALMPSRLGLIREDADFSHGLALTRTSPIERITDEYSLLTNKRKDSRYVANRRVVELRGASGESLRIIFQVSNDGVAFRYEFPESTSQVRRIVEETSSYVFLPGTRAWLQPMSAAKTGWQSVNPSYEELYEKDIAAGTPSPTGAGWVYPALFRSGEVWTLVSESSLPRNYCGTRLQSKWNSTEYTVAFPQPLERVRNGPVNPESTLPWITPWRFIVIGTLKTIVESTLGTDLADKPAPSAKAPADGPGKASWSWPLLGDDQTNFAVQKRFIDYAAAMNWRYTLVDALWDKQIGYEKLKELVDYAAGKGVRILVWYNSAGDWNTAPQTPRDRMLTHESRISEFERLKSIGVAGLKVDFFGGDGQSVISYYHDILEDAAPYGFLMNFHGATLPRGWQRTYPHLMTTEAVRGLEFVTFEQKNAEDEPTHAAMLPFTRNVFDPMDFTPMVLDRIQRIERRTTSAFELALCVLFTSGIQHYAEIPEGMAKAPDYVQEFLRHVPSVWDDVRFIDGFPGKHVVIARQGEGRWYVAGINGENQAAALHMSFADLPVQGRGTLISDGARGNLSFRREAVQLTAQKTLDITVPPRGGFVLVFD